MHFSYYQNICVLIAFELLFVCLFVVCCQRKQQTMWSFFTMVWVSTYALLHPRYSIATQKKKYKQVWWQLLLWLYFIAWWMVKNTIHTLYRTYNIHCNYCCIFLSSARKIMSTCQKICQHARWLSTCKIIMWIMLTSY